MEADESCDSSRLEVRIREQAEAEGLSVEVYLERLVAAERRGLDDMEKLALEGLNSGGPTDIGLSYWEDKHRSLKRGCAAVLGEIWLQGSPAGRSDIEEQAYYFAIEASPTLATNFFFRHETFQLLATQRKWDGQRAGKLRGSLRCGCFA